jgi:hypothetical protein
MQLFGPTYADVIRHPTHCAVGSLLAFVGRLILTPTVTPANLDLHIPRTPTTLRALAAPVLRSADSVY